MGIKNKYKHTIAACCIGYVVQAIVVNFAPLLFLTFNNTYKIPLEHIGLLVTVNFCIQIVMDMLVAKYVDKMGYRVTALMAHVFAAAGLFGLAFLPDIMPSPFVGLCIATLLYGTGGGLLEVVISPMVEACPSDEKAGTMSLLHSFFCWGSVLVVAVSTLLFKLMGMSSWRLVSCLWAMLPVANFFYFLKVPIVTLCDNEKGVSISELLRKKLFWIFIILMLCAGAAELSMSQWASALAESGLGVSKTVGDLAGPCFFAVLMGASRVFHAKFSEKIDLSLFLGASAALGIISYLMTSLSENPVISLIGCGLCGVSVAVMWPGTLSLASQKIPGATTAMFAFMALAGDIGCASGPTMVGYVSAALGDDLKKGILSAIIFPLFLLLGVIWCKKTVSDR